MLIDLRVLWPERAAGFAAAIIAGGALFLWLILALGVGTLKDAGLNRAAFGWFADGEVGLLLPLWLGLRAIHTGIAFVRRYRNPRRNLTAAPGRAPESMKNNGERQA